MLRRARGDRHVRVGDPWGPNITSLAASQRVDLEAGTPRVRAKHCERLLFLSLRSGTTPHTSNPDAAAIACYGEAHPIFCCAAAASAAAAAQARRGVPVLSVDVAGRAAEQEAAADGVLRRTINGDVLTMASCGFASEIHLSGFLRAPPTPVRVSGASAGIDRLQRGKGMPALYPYLPTPMEWRRMPHPCDTWASAFAGGGFVTFGLSEAAERAAVVHMHEHQRRAGPCPEGTPGEPAFEARRAAYVARYCTSVRDDPPPYVMGAALVREVAVTALMAEEEAAAALEPRPDVALTAADAAGHALDGYASDASDSSGDRWDRFDTYEGVRAHLDDLAALRGLVGPGDVGLA